MSDWYGATYWYPTTKLGTRQAGVKQGLGGDIWIVAYQGNGGCHRIKTPALAASTDPAALQEAWDAWAHGKGLEPVCHDTRTRAAEGEPVCHDTRTDPDQLPGSGVCHDTQVEASAALAVSNAMRLPVIPELPQGWEAKAELVDRCIATGKRLSLWVAVLLAKAVEDFADPSEWRRACMTRWGLSKEFVGQARDAGLLLLRPSSRVCHDTLSRLAIDKLYHLFKVPEHLLPKLLERNDVAGMARDKVRDLCRVYCSAAGGPPETTAGKRGQRPHGRQLDFLDDLFAAAQDDAKRDQFVTDGDITPIKAAAGGLLLLDVGLIKYESDPDPDLGDIEALIEDLDRHRVRAQALLGRAGKKLLKA